MRLQVANEAYWKNANDLVDPERPGDFNQALMEIGATVCTPKNPSCSHCPLKKTCHAYKELVQKTDIEDIENYPSTGKSSKIASFWRIFLLRAIVSP